MQALNQPSSDIGTALDEENCFAGRAIDPGPEGAGALRSTRALVTSSPARTIAAMSLAPCRGLPQCGRRAIDQST